MRTQAIKRTAALGAVIALGAAPAALAVKPADPGSQSGEHGKSGQEHGKSGGKTVMYVFKGSYDGASGVAVDHGNAHVRKADLLDTTVTFDLSTARVVVGDVNGDGSKDLLDVAAGDRVVVKARLPRKEPGTQPFKAKQLVDQTHAASSDSD
jgi:hypothetical protein